MRISVSFLSLVGLALCGCETKTVSYQAGTSFVQAERDAIDCEVQALQRLPATATSDWVTVQEPDTVKCDSKGQCEVISGGRTRKRMDVDTNAARRDAAQTRCLADRGYREISLPTCPLSVYQSLPPTLTGVMPPLTANTCYVDRRNVGIQIFNP